MIVAIVVLQSEIVIEISRPLSCLLSETGFRFLLDCIDRMSGDQQTNTNSRTSGAVESTKGDTQRNMIEEIQSRWKNQTQQNQSSHQQPPLQPNPKTDK